MANAKLIDMAGRTWACAKYARRARAYAVSLSLMQAVLHCRNAPLLRAAKEAQRAAMRERLVSGFAGYLVTDPEPDQMTIWRGIGGRVTLLVLTGKRVCGLRDDAKREVVGQSCMDAPYFVPTGSVVRCELGGEYCAAVDAIQRGRCVA